MICPQCEQMRVEHDAARTKALQLHTLLDQARNYVNPEEHPEWEEEASRELVACDERYDRLERELVEAREMRNNARRAAAAFECDLSRQAAQAEKYRHERDEAREALQPFAEKTLWEDNYEPGTEEYLESAASNERMDMWIRPSWVRAARIVLGMKPRITPRAPERTSNEE